MERPVPPPISQPQETSANDATPHYLAICVTHYDNGIPDVIFKLLPTMAMQRLFTSYCNHKNIHRSTVCFVFNGNKVVEEDTAQKVGCRNLLGPMSP